MADKPIVIYCLMNSYAKQETTVKKTKTKTK